MAAKRGQSRWLPWLGAFVAGAVVGGSAVALWSPWPDARSRVGRAKPLTSGIVAVGSALYLEHCASCHGAQLEGQAEWKVRLPDGRYPAPPHDETGHTWHHDDAYLFSVTKLGGQAMTSSGQVSGMPSFEGVLSDAEIWSILEFIKSTWPPEIRAHQRRAR